MELLRRGDGWLGEGGRAGLHTASQDHQDGGGPGETDCTLGLEVPPNTETCGSPPRTLPAPAHLAGQLPQEASPKTGGPHFPSTHSAEHHTFPRCTASSPGEVSLS